jgi:hypothetical protein
MLDFAEIKKIGLTDIAGRYGIKLRFKGDWASAPCPLPTHKAGDKGRNFTINLSQNYWRCFSESCNGKNGGKKGGDCINFVALMENCREREAAQKIAEWHGLNGNKTAPHIAERRSQEIPSDPSQKDLPDHNPVSDSGKGFIKALDGWFNELFQLGPELVDDVFWKERRNAVKSKVLESYRNGKLART